jgi:hypothetical protein
MGRCQRLRGLAALVLLTVAAAACGAPLGHGDRAVHYDSVGELVAAADAVVVGRVAGTGRGRVIDEEDAVLTFMNVRVAVEQVWAGRMPAPSFTLERPGWERVDRRPGWRGLFDPAGERDWRTEGELRLEEGDRGVFFLAWHGRPTGWETLGPEGLYLVDGGELADSGRSDPTVRKVEPMTVTALQAAVAAAARRRSG